MVILSVKKIFINQKGQSLVEAVAAVALVAVVVVVLSTLAIGSVRNAYFAKQQSIASFYGQQGIELTRSVRDQDGIVDWSGTLPPSSKFSALWGQTLGAGVLFKLVQVGVNWQLEQINDESFGESFSGGFKRTVKISDDSGSCGSDPTKIKRVLVRVTWKDNKSELISCLTKIENLK